MKTSLNVWAAAEAAIVAGDAATLARWLREHGTLLQRERPQSRWLGGLAPDYSSVEARTIIAREHHFATWEEFARFARALKRGTARVVRFENAVDAVVAGDLAALRSLLRTHPELLRARSPRSHRSTLLHYVGANGVEGWRQRTPGNAVAVTETLLAAGAEIDAAANMYGGGATTLGLVATSIHPLQAGVQNALIDVLLKHGAAVHDPHAAGNRQNLINGCLANGRPGAAEFLAQRGAPLDLEGAAGVGRLDVVKCFVRGDGRLQSGATRAQLRSGFQWACEYGRVRVIEFVLACGLGLDASRRHRGQTGLHWAAYGGHASIVRLLLKLGVAVNLKDTSWGSTPLGWALHGWANPPFEMKRGHYHDVVSQLVAAGGTVRRASIPRERVQGDRRMRAALGEQFSP